MNFTNQPPEPTTLPYPIIRVPKGGKVALTCLTPTYTGVYTHFDGTKTVECPPGGRCAFCAIGKQNRWQGYVLGIGGDNAITSLFHFTNNAVSMIERDLKGDRNWLFRRIVFQRGNAHDNSPLRGYVYGIAQGLDAISQITLIRAAKAIYAKNGSAPLMDVTSTLPSNG